MEGKAEPTFAAEMTRWRRLRGWSKKRLAEEMGFDPSYISHVEHGRHPASEDFARRADVALGAADALLACWRRGAAQMRGGDTRAAGRPAPLLPTGGLVVERDEARLRYADGAYHAAMRRLIHNTGPDPVSRYLIRISVDAFPGQPDRSNRHYREHPLTWDELGLSATCEGRAMTWRPKQDRDSFKEAWLCFADGQGRSFPLYPGERAWLEYGYRVGDDKWGPWFQRAVRLPTTRLSVRLVFPARLRATVWGSETSLTAEAVPLRTAIQRRRDGEEDVFDWSIAHPPLHARYRLEWRFDGEDGVTGRDVGVLPRRASERMRAAGIVQRGDPRLTEVAAPFDLPAQAELARRVVDEVFAAMQRVAEHHVFGKGMGLSAPQIGIGRAAVVVQPAGDDAEPIVLLNPRIVEESAEVDEQYEGCLSFFDVRGRVPRARRVVVQHVRPDGVTAITAFTDAVARLVAHEVDHVYGRLYLDRMRPGVSVIPVEEYRGIGRSWRYG